MVFSTVDVLALEVMVAEVAQLPHLVLMLEWAALVVVVVAELLYQVVREVLAPEAAVEDLAGMIAYLLVALVAWVVLELPG